MKWPIINESWKGPIRTTEVEYLTRFNRIKLDTEVCTACGQCVKACPKNVLEKPEIPKGVKLPKVQRVPIMANPLDCFFCGICMALCPFNAISFEENGNKMVLDDLPISKTGMLPTIVRVKMRKVELEDQEFNSEFWEGIIGRISTKKAKTVQEQN